MYFPVCKITKKAHLKIKREILKIKSKHLLKVSSYGKYIARACVIAEWVLYMRGATTICNSKYEYKIMCEIHIHSMLNLHFSPLH